MLRGYQCSRQSVVYSFRDSSLSGADWIPPQSRLDCKLGVPGPGFPRRPRGNAQEAQNNMPRAREEQRRERERRAHVERQRAARMGWERREVERVRVRQMQQRERMLRKAAQQAYAQRDYRFGAGFGPAGPGRGPGAGSEEYEKAEGKIWGEERGIEMWCGRWRC